MAIMAVAGFVLGLSFDKLFTKSYADERKTELILPEESSFEVMSTGSTARADYEIVIIHAHRF